MKIYVAGASSEALQISSYMRHLETSGHTVPHDWTVQVLDHARRGVADHQISPRDQMVLADADLQAVMKADIFWYVLPEAGKTSRGAWVEYGYALAYYRTFGSPTLFISGDRTQSIFLRTANGLFDTHDEALQAICSIGGD